MDWKRKYCLDIGTSRLCKIFQYLNFSYELFDKCQQANNANACMCTLIDTLFSRVILWFSIFDIDTT